MSPGIPRHKLLSDIDPYKFGERQRSWVRNSIAASPVKFGAREGEVLDTDSMTDGVTNAVAESNLLTLFQTES